jgi:hypothetical protein
MDYYFEKRFLLLLNEVGTGEIKFTYFLRKGRVEMVYHFLPHFFHSFLYPFKRFKRLVNQDERILFNFRRLLRNS